jgi:hypothetical protein
MRPPNLEERPHWTVGLGAAECTQTAAEIIINRLLILFLFFLQGAVSEGMFNAVQSAHVHAYQ